MITQHPPDSQCLDSHLKGWLRESEWCSTHRHTHNTKHVNTGLHKSRLKHTMTQHCTPQEYHLTLSLQLSSSFVPKLVPKDVFIFKPYCFEPSCRLAWEPSVLNLTYHWSVCIIFRCLLSGHRASVDRYMTDLCTRKEGQSIQSYWSPGSMKGQRSHNAEATSQHPPIASRCESSALRLVKCELRCTSVCSFDWEKVSSAGGICRAAHAWTCPAPRFIYEHSHVWFTVSEVLGQPTFVSLAWINNC